MNSSQNQFYYQIIKFLGLFFVIISLWEVAKRIDFSRNILKKRSNE